MAGLTDLTDATPAGEIDPEASKSAVERAAEAERLEAARAAALERASQAEEEAAAAVRDRDEAATRARAALDRAAKERAAAAASSPITESPGDDAGDSPKPYAGKQDLQDALLLHEAAAIMNLHAQAVGVQNIRGLVPIVLDSLADNYSRWRESFLLTLGKFSLQDHVLYDGPAPAVPDWIRMDCVVSSWIHGTVSSDIADALDRGCTHRALYLDAAFRDFSQGDLSINDYCSQFKKKAEKLRDLGEHITDRTLVLNILRGLNEQYSVVASHLRRGRPFPTYADAKAELLMEELSLKHRSTAPATALVAAAGASASAPPAAPSASGGKQQQQQRRGKRGGQKNKTGGSGGSNTSSTAGQKASGASPDAPRGWPSFYNPWIGMIQMWPGPRPPLAPIPTAPQQPQHQQQHALVAQQHQQAPPVPFQQPAGAGQWASPVPNYYNPLVGSPTWDQRSLASAFSTMTVTPPSDGDWYFDSGASSHMASDAGSSVQERDHQVQ
ncbi:uncharacterized protein LOC120645819 [Panicum virgatum]|uniref:uncharacterized protein LOC120645819 n=1 Tax=Panicum virgatum TaxID=38727 RepID=UPI0019D54E97|nr:uncharacterized protein LOC120645819 [Panicum virgatum]